MLRYILHSRNGIQIWGLRLSILMLLLKSKVLAKHFSTVYITPCPSWFLLSHLILFSSKSISWLSNSTHKSVNGSSNPAFAGQDPKRKKHVSPVPRPPQEVRNKMNHLSSRQREPNARLLQHWSYPLGCVRLFNAQRHPSSKWMVHPEPCWNALDV